MLRGNWRTSITNSLQTPPTLLMPARRQRYIYIATILCSHCVRWELCEVTSATFGLCCVTKVAFCWGFEVNIAPRSFYFSTALLVNVNSYPQNMMCLVQKFTVWNTLYLFWSKQTLCCLQQTLVRSIHTCSFVQTKLKMLRVRYKQGESERALLLLQLKSRVKKIKI